VVLEKLRIAREVYEADRITNLPNMKVHYATGITLALKNLKGLLVGNEKRHFHEVGLDKGDRGSEQHRTSPPERRRRHLMHGEAVRGIGPSTSGSRGVRRIPSRLRSV